MLQSLNWLLKIAQTVVTVLTKLARQLATPIGALGNNNIHA